MASFYTAPSSGAGIPAEIRFTGIGPVWASVGSGDLPARERVAWTLQRVEGEPLERVARMCGCSLATAKRRIAAAQRSFERVLS